MDVEPNNQNLREQHFTEWQRRSLFTQAASFTVTSNSPHQIYGMPNYINPDYAISKPNHGDSGYRKRPRRKPEEINRVYICNWLGCVKAYGNLSHLNSHVKNAAHGPKRERKGIVDLFTHLISRVSTEILRANPYTGRRTRTGKCREFPSQ